MFSLSNLSVTIGQSVLLRDVSASFKCGQITGLIGHNGSGKSTLVKVLARQIHASAGVVTCGGLLLGEISPREFARQVAYLPQNTADSGQMTVRELVACGRYPWHGALGRFGKNDREKVAQAMETTGVAGLADRSVATLSGGERQRVWLAMLIAQNSRFLLLDEPTSALDISHQIEVLSLIQRLSHETGLGVVVIVHDINMAVRFCDRMLALKGGRLIAEGPAAALMRSDTLAEIYGTSMGITPHPSLGIPMAYAN